MVEPDLRAIAVTGAWRIAWRVASLLALVALPFVAGDPIGAQEDGANENRANDSDEGGGEGVNTDVVTVRGARPLVPIATESSVGSVARPRQSPFLVACGERVLLGNLVWEPGAGDRIELHELGARSADAVAGSGKKPAATARIVDANPAEIMRPVAAVDHDGVLWLAWTGLVDGRAQLVATREEGAAFAPPKVLTNGPLPNLLPRLACAADGRIWIAWEAEVADAGGTTRRNALAAPLERDLTLGAATVVHDGQSGGAADVAIAAGGGALWIAWSEWRRDDYEIVLRRLDPSDRSLGAAIVVSDDPRGDDSHPSLACAPDGTPWIGWDHVEIAARGESGPRRASVRQHDGTIRVEVRVACWRDGAIVAPKSTAQGVPDGVVAGAPSLTTGGGTPKLAFDRAGRLWVAYRYLEARDGQRKFGFPVIVQRLAAEGWSEPFAAEESVGNAEEPALLALPEGGVAAAFSRDERVTITARERKEPSPKLVSALVSKGLTHSRWHGIDSIGIARAAVDGSATFPPLVARAARPAPRESSSPNDLDDPYVTGAKRFEVVRGDERYQVFWGDLHRHSNISRCSIGLEPGPADRFAQARDLHRCDFFALTDHSGAIAPADGWLIDKLNWLYAAPGFTTLAGFEWSTQEFGHHNVILPDRLSLLVPPDYSLQTLYKNMRRRGAITIPHHPSDRSFPNDWSVVDDQYTRLVELFQACRGNFEFDGCFRQSNTAGALGSFMQDALNAGQKFGLIASTDHSYGQSYACALAPAQDRASVFAALTARRTYGATAKGLFIDLRVGEALMGESIEASGTLPIALTVRGTKELVDVAIFRNGRVFRSLREAAGAPMTTLAPMRIVARLAANRGPCADDWSLTLDCREGAFSSLIEPISTARRRSAKRPQWDARGNRAELLIPAGCETGRSANHPVHLAALGDAKLTLKVGGTTSTLTVAELVAESRTISVPGLGDLTLGVDMSDAAVDLAKTLGQREMTLQWEDPSARENAVWYYARLIQTDGEMAWSSPIFVSPKP